MSNTCNSIVNLFTTCKKATNDDDLKAIEILATIIDSQSHSAIDLDVYENDEEGREQLESDFSEIFEAVEEIATHLGEDDFYLEFDGNEYRLIHDDAIWQIYVDEIKSIVGDCYDLKLDDIPDFIAWEIDWEQTAKNAHADGYGHTFSSYDHSEQECNGYYIFRTN